MFAYLSTREKESVICIMLLWDVVPMRAQNRNMNKLYKLYKITFNYSCTTCCSPRPDGHQNATITKTVWIWLCWIQCLSIFMNFFNLQKSGKNVCTLKVNHNLPCLYCFFGIFQSILNAPRGKGNGIMYDSPLLLTIQCTTGSRNTHPYKLATIYRRTSYVSVRTTPTILFIGFWVPLLCFRSVLEAERRNTKKAPNQSGTETTSTHKTQNRWTSLHTECTYQK